MRAKCWCAGIAAVLSMALASGTALALDIPLTVEEPVGVARAAEPCWGGIPVPAGQFKADQAFALFDGAKEVPVQVVPMVVDEKGFLRWVLVDFQTDLAAREKKSFTLRTMKGSAAPAKPLTVAKDAAGVAVDTGAIAFTIAADMPFGLFTTVTAGGRPVVTGGAVSYTDSFDGKTYTADKPTSVDVEYAGPMRTTVCVKGRFVGDDQTKLLYIARVTAWSGKSDVHVKYSLANSNEEHYTWRRIRDSSIRLRLAGVPTATLVGADKSLDAGVQVWIEQSARVVKGAAHGEDNLGGASWLQRAPGATQPGAAKAMSADQELWTSPPKVMAEGWIAAKVGAATVVADDLYFVEDPPRRLAVEESQLVLSGIAEPLSDLPTPFSDKHRWIMDSSHLSSQYRLDFAGPGAAADLSAKSKADRGRVHVLANPAWYFETEALPHGKFGTQADELKCYDVWGWKYDPKEIPRAPTGVIAAMGRWSGGDDNHYVSEQDTLDDLVVMYLRTGARGYLDSGESWANYFMDLQSWRTDGWRYKDGGVWWPTGGPLGSAPQRKKDPVTGAFNGVPGAPWSTSFKAPFTKEAILDLWFLAWAKGCYCHNWGEGLVQWYMITGDRDAYEAAIDTVEQNIDTQKRAFRKVPGKTPDVSRDFTRASFLTHATRLIAPTDPFVVDASDYLAAVYLKRPDVEPRGFENGPHPLTATLRDLPRAPRPKAPTSGPAPVWDQAKADREAVEKWLTSFVGVQGFAAMQEAGVTFDYKTGQLTDPKTGATWYPLVEPHTWMFPPLSQAMECYYRITGNEDARDWLIAYGEAVAHVLFQPKHGNLSYGRMLADFPLKGVVKDWASWVLPEDCKNGEGNNTADGTPVAINGYLAQFYPDVPARAYEFTGDPFLKQRAYDYWYWGSHRGYNAPKMRNLGRVGWWIDVYTTHSESVGFTGKTIYIWSHPRADEKPPVAVKDLAVTVAGDKATVTFTAPADEGGGKVVAYQVKCSDKPIVDYATFLKAFAANTESAVTNCWMAANVAGEPTPKAAGTRETFAVSGVPANAKYFVVLAFDDSSNRSAMSNVAEAGK